MSTQTRHPKRASIRTGFQVTVAVATLIPYVVAGIWGDPEAIPGLVLQVVAVSTATSRVMALPQVAAFIDTWLPWLAAEPAGDQDEA